MSRQYSHQAEGNRSHHHERQRVGSEDPGEDQEDQHERGDETNLQVVQGTAFRPAPPSQRILDRIAGRHLGKDAFVQQAVDLAGGRHPAIDGRGDVDCEVPVRMAEHVESASDGEIDHGVERHQLPGGRRDGVRGKADQAVALGVGEHDSNLDLVVALGEELDEAPGVRASQLPAHLRDAESERLAHRCELEDELALTVGQVVRDGQRA